VGVGVAGDVFVRLQGYAGFPGADDEGNPQGVVRISLASAGRLVKGAQDDRLLLRKTDRVYNHRPDNQGGQPGYIAAPRKNALLIRGFQRGLSGTPFENHRYLKKLVFVSTGVVSAK
jgi:hypothetical protein